MYNGTFSENKEKMFKTYSMELGGRTLSVDIGRVSAQANGAALMHYGDTTVLCTATASDKPRDGIDFFPLSVEYEEKLYAVGKIPGGFNKREGKASENAILTSRVIDRPMRPLFPKDYRNDVTLNNMVMSVDPTCRPELVAMLGAAIATSISDIPFNGPCATTQVGMVDGEFIINPSQEQWKNGDLNLTVASTAEKVIMIEAGANEIVEEKMIEAMYGAHVFYEDGLEEIFPEVYDFAVVKQDVKAVGRPSLTDMQISDDNVVTIVLTTDVYPEVTLGQYKGMEVEKAEATVADAQIEAELNRMAENVASTETVERAAEMGDTANIDFEGFDNDVPFNGGKGEKFDAVGENYLLGGGQRVKSAYTTGVSLNGVYDTRDNTHTATKGFYFSLLGEVLPKGLGNYDKTLFHIVVGWYLKDGVGGGIR